jgi:tetratricopeptide (TPR) repeat protein
MMKMNRSIFLAASLMLAVPVLSYFPPTSAYAQNKKPKKPSAENKKLYQESMKKARTTQTKDKDAKGAIPFFQEALKAIPDDPRALAELGYAAYVAKEYTLAKESTEKSLALSQDPNLRGAALYNLGLIQVALGDNKGAAQSYMLSFYARPNKTVLAALQKIDAATAALVDPFTAKPSTSVTSPESYYTDEGLEHSEFKKLSVDGDYLEAKILEGNSMRSSNYDLFVKTKLGWHQMGLVGGYTQGPGLYAGFSLGKVSYEDVIPGGSKEILIEGTEIYHYEDVNTEILYDAEDTYLFVCSLAAKVPSCLRVQLSHNEKSAPFGNLDDSYNVTSYTKEQGWKLSYSFGADGQLTVTQDKLLGKTKKLPAEAAIRLGTKALTFY